MGIAGFFGTLSSQDTLGVGSWRCVGGAAMQGLATTSAGLAELFFMLIDWYYLPPWRRLSAWCRIGVLFTGRAII